MNLKEAFRYQKFLETLLESATNIIANPFLATKTIKIHLVTKSYPAGTDFTEEQDTSDRYENSVLIDFVQDLIIQRESLTKAITLAKDLLPFDLDAALEGNRVRRTLCKSMQKMLKSKGNKHTETTTGYCFNAEGNQVPFQYELQVIHEETYDRRKVKSQLSRLLKEADAVSEKIDQAFLSINVEYTPVYDINGTFEDAVEQFIAAAE